MIQKLLFVFCLIIIGSAVATAQSRTVTNTDLDKYRQPRIKAEQDLRENYERLGFPSPEERAKRDEASRKALIELSDKLRQERLERERIQAERQAEVSRAAWAYRAVQPTRPQQWLLEDDNFYPFIGFESQRPRRNSNRFGGRAQQGYFAGGQFWPTGPRTRSTPILVRPRR